MPSFLDVLSVLTALFVIVVSFKLFHRRSAPTHERRTSRNLVLSSFLEQFKGMRETVTHCFTLNSDAAIAVLDGTQEIIAANAACTTRFGTPIEHLVKSERMYFSSAFLF